MAGSEAPVEPRRRDLTWVAALVVGIGVFAIYRATLLPGLGAWDTGEAQTVLPILGTMHPTGFPAYTIIGWLASIVLSPLGSPAFTINLLSAILVATAVGLTVVVARSLRVPLAVGMAAAVGFGLSPIVWRVATGADAHALHAVLLVAIVGLLLRWERLARDAAEHPDDARLRGRADRAIVLAAAVFGVSVANHGLTLLLIPAVGLFVLAVEPRIVFRPKVVAAALGACIGVAALLYLELPLRAGPFRAPLVYGHPETIRGFLEVVLATQFQGSVTREVLDIAGRVEDLVALAFAQYGALLLLVPSGFLVAAVRHPRYALLSGVATVTTCVFAASYENAAIQRYYIGPAFFAWTWIAILGGAVVEWVVSRAGEAPGRVAAERRRVIRPPHRQRGRRGAAAADRGRPADPVARGRPVGDRLDPRLARRGVHLDRAQRCRGVVVVLLDAPVVRPAGRAPPAGHLGHRRPDAPRRAPGQHHGRDRG